jgi:hypothetical protein
MAETTPGQAACVAWNGHYAEQHGIEARNEWAASDPHGRGAWESAAKAAITAGAPAELAAAMAETRKVADAASEILAGFKRGSDGYRARLSGVNLMRAYEAIGRPVPDRLRHLEGQ